ncbi:MAG: hypothetical protein OEZ55_13465 [Nitrospinota bacterium]|nr:hypothetical protein [Nitrospinota bacterium]
MKGLTSNITTGIEKEVSVRAMLVWHHAAARAKNKRRGQEAANIKRKIYRYFSEFLAMFKGIRPVGGAPDVDNLWDTGD